jgi:beta-glucanase (GH16 family)
VPLIRTRRALFARGLHPGLCLAFSAQAAPPTGSGWQITFSDEFEGESLDPQKWRHHGTGLRRQAHNTPGAVKVAGGNLTISTFSNGGTHFTGMVSTAQTFLYSYGYIEARINFDTSPGMWSAFWMQSPTMIYSADTNLAGTEIDICEHRAVDAGSSDISAKIVGNAGIGTEQINTP